MGNYIFVLIFAITITIVFFTPTTLGDLTMNINLNEPIEDASNKCWSIDKPRTTDQWCIDNCLHIPPFCPEDICKCEEHSCYADDTNPYRRFGARTSYLVNANLDDTEVSVPGCKPIMLWHNIHHGIRGPHKNEIAAMKKTMPAIRQAIVQAFADGKSKLCEKDINNLKNWRIIYTSEEDRILGEAGRKEMRELGQRMAKRFPGLLKDSQKTVKKTSPDQRTTESMKAFLMGLYGHPVDFEESTEDMLTFYENCQAWINLNLNNKTYIQMEKLKESPEYEKMVEEISDRTGVKLIKTQVEIAYIVCRYEFGNYPDAVSPWCALFSKNDLKLMEYADDLRYYYLDGYGNNISGKMVQPLVADLHQHFSSLGAGHENIQAFLYVVHSRIAHSILLPLGLYKDEEPPLATDWPTPHTLWRTSKMLSFGHNLALVALQCDDPQDQFKVLAMHQERRISQFGICGQEICPLQSFLDNIKLTADIDFDKVCRF